jgi:LL-diaminopimelate aminotransferase
LLSHFWGPLYHGVPDIPPSQRLIKKLEVFCSKENSHNHLTFIRPTKTLEMSIGSYLDTICPVPKKTYGTMMSAGSKEVIFHISLSLLNPDDVVLIPEIAYPYYRSAAELAGAEVITYPLEPHSFLPIPEELETTVLQRVKLIWLNNPHNPTGTVVPNYRLNELINWCQTHDIVLCHDVVYRSIVFNNHRVPSVLGHDGNYTNLLEIHSFSKILSVAGWRVAITVGDPQLIQIVRQSLFLSSNGLFLAIQNAIRYALIHFDEFSSQITRQYAGRVKAFATALDEKGLAYCRPQGAYYFWITVPENMEDIEFVKHLLIRTGILVFPGSAFGYAGRHFFRVSLVKPESVLIKAANSLAECGLFK